MWRDITHADRVGNVDWFYAVFKPAQTTKSTWVVFSKSQATYDKFVDDTLRKLRRNPNSTVHISMRIDESRFEQRPKWVLSFDLYKDNISTSG
ncbi:hypothetical protein H4Q26_009241 [Puccinia striiformis f. sp. tritici PST-130]|nr:hypothetical protein H4Q26_009241 [Puccinia striiformis f. sp. tritici PST-130]